MKKLLFLLLLPLSVFGQNIARNPTGSFDGQIRSFDGCDFIGDGSYGQYRWDINSTATDDSVWVIQPIGISGSGRWTYVWPRALQLTMKLITTSTYTVTPSDFNKMLVMTYNGARTVTMPSIANVNAPTPVWIKDGSNSAALNPITINATDSIDNGFSASVTSNNGVIGISKNSTSTKFLGQ